MSTTPTSTRHQTIRIGRGRHLHPREGVCVMELASLLAGGPFTDRPACACPLIAAFLRGYNDGLPDAHRHRAVVGWASHVVGTRDLDPAVLDARAAAIDAFAHRALPWGLQVRLRAAARRTAARIVRCEEVGLRVGQWVGGDAARRAAVDDLLGRLCGLPPSAGATGRQPAPELAIEVRRMPRGIPGDGQRVLGDGELAALEG